MTKKELAKYVAERTGSTYQVTMNITDEIFKTIAEKMSISEKVQISGFGTFSTIEKGEREGRNPYSGESVRIQAHLSPRFKAGKNLKDKMRTAYQRNSI